MKLAIFTGKPAFKKALYVGAPIVEKEVRKSYFKYMEKVFANNWFTNNGPLVQKLEAEIANRHGARHCIALCNGTIAEIIALKALNLKGEIILPSFTFIATAHACLWQNIETVFCDISPETLCIDAKAAEKLITKKTCGIFGVHLFSNICDIDALLKLCKKYNLKLIFDAAHAFNCSWGDTPIGAFGDAVILSFHATKFFGTFEGGAILTNNSELAERIRFLVNFGFCGYDNVKFLGINGKMSESSAAMGLASIQAIDDRLIRLKNTFSVYCAQLSPIPGITVLPVGQNGHSNYQYIVIFVDEKRFGISRDILYNILWKENIIARRYFYPGCHRMEPYINLYPDAYKRLPVTEKVAKSVLCLPANLRNPEKDIRKIANIIRTAHENIKEISAWARTSKQL